MAGRGKGGAGQLLAVQAVVHLLGAVHALGQGTGQGFGFKVIAETGHIACGRANGGWCAFHIRGVCVFGQCSSPCIIAILILVAFVTNKP